MNQDINDARTSLNIISEMIGKARVNIASGAKYFLLWGWAAFACCIAQFILQRYNIQNSYMVWMAMPLCAIISIIMARNDERKATVRTFIEDSMRMLWTGLGISFAILAVIFIKSGWEFSMPFYILIYSTGTFISGRLLRFSPLVIGGIISYVICLASIWSNIEYHSLLGAVSLLASYIIPGHLLKKIKD